MLLGMVSVKRLGSSPRVRGSLLRFDADLAPYGIIPAGAGLTRRMGNRRGGGRDHPRGCGAHKREQVESSWQMGSSPRVRGSPVAMAVPNATGRIIPAGAGLTRTTASLLGSSWDHPRGCGAHSGFQDTRREVRGSSPRVRGSPSLPVSFATHAGIIPAGAGLT